MRSTFIAINSKIYPFPQRNRTIHHEGIIEAYFMCGEIKKANSILKEYQEILNQQLIFFNSLKSKTRESIEQELYETMAQMEELRILLRTYGQSDPLLELGL